MTSKPSSAPQRAAEEMKACPFCGEPPLELGRGFYVHKQGTDCPFPINSVFTAKQWNTRKAHAPLIEAAEKAIEECESYIGIGWDNANESAGAVKALQALRKAIAEAKGCRHE